MAIQLASEDADISFNCIGPLSTESASRVSPESLPLHRALTSERNGIILTLGPDVLPVTARVLDDVSFAVGLRTLNLPALSYSEHENVYWTVLGLDQPIFVPSDADAPIDVQRSRFFGFGNEIVSQIPVSNGSELYGRLIEDCRELQAFEATPWLNRP